MKINYEYRFFHGCQEFVQCPFNDPLTGAACNFIKKETLAQVFSCEFYEFYEISKSTFSHRTPLVAASVP